MSEHTCERPDIIGSCLECLREVSERGGSLPELDAGYLLATNATLDAEVTRLRARIAEVERERDEAKRLRADRFHAAVQQAAGPDECVRHAEWMRDGERKRADAAEKERDEQRARAEKAEAECATLRAIAKRLADDSHEHKRAEAWREYAAAFARLPATCSTASPEYMGPPDSCARCHGRGWYPKCDADGYEIAEVFCDCPCGKERRRIEAPP